MNAAEQLNDQEAAFQADLFSIAYDIGFMRAKFDYQKNGYFSPLHYPEGTPEHAGYSSFVKSVRNLRKTA